MKRNVTSLQFLLQLKGLAVVLALFFVCTAGQAQNGVPVDFGDLSSVVWKVNADIDQVISTEHDKITVALAGSPDMQPDERAVYMGYQRLLNYIQEALQAGKTTEEAIRTSYDQVIAEAPKDPVLAYMPDGFLASFVPGLVESMTAAQVPVAH